MQKICTKYARNMHKYVRNMHEICNYMSEICIKYAQYIDCISHIWKKYALNMPEICTNMQIICSYMLKICSYMPKICNKYAQYIDCISRICKKYAVKICRNMQFYMQNMHKSIYCIYCIYMHSPLCWCRPGREGGREGGRVCDREPSGPGVWETAAAQETGAADSESPAFPQRSGCLWKLFALIPMRAPAERCATRSGAARRLGQSWSSLRATRNGRRFERLRRAT